MCTNVSFHQYSVHLGLDKWQICVIACVRSQLDVFASRHLYDKEFNLPAGIVYWMSVGDFLLTP